MTGFILELFLVQLLYFMPEILVLKELWTPEACVVDRRS